MCHRCEKQVIEQGVLESDLPMLPYTLVKWRCIVPGCRGGSRAKDYGMSPFYFDPCKRRHNEKKGTWRGGWFDATGHFYVCSHHSKQWERICSMMEHRFSPEYFLTKIVTVPAKAQQSSHNLPHFPINSHIHHD